MLSTRKSNIPNAGQGLFADDPAAGANSVIFKKGDWLCPYVGELISQATLDQRYGKGTQTEAPYAAKVEGNNLYVDAARVRGWGAFANNPIKRNKPNAEFYVREEHNQGYTLWLAAAVDIKNGKEILLDYNMGPFTSTHSTKPSSGVRRK